jgi:hypothetical protein
MNFIAGTYYVKLLCFECGGNPEDILLHFANKIVERIKQPGQLPSLLRSFPDAGRIRNSEKFILKNVLGYSFLKRGYFASYKIDNVEFDCFILDTGHAETADNMLRQYLDRKEGVEINSSAHGFHIKDRYYANIFVARIGSFICGVMKIPSGSEETGRSYLNALLENLKDHPER